jgi:hypothetical protein
VSDRAARAVEIASIVVIGLAVLLAGWPLLENLARYRVPSVALLLVLAGAQAFALRRNAAAGGSASRIRATRDVAFVGAILVALAFVLSPHRWAIGASVSLVEFAIVLELLARFAPSPSDAS